MWHVVLLHLFLSAAYSLYYGRHLAVSSPVQPQALASAIKATMLYNMLLVLRLRQKASACARQWPHRGNATGRVACFAGEVVPQAPGCWVYLTESCVASQ
jgi:hypothetical protein